MWPALKRLEISIYVSTVKKQGEGGCQRAINLYFHPSEPKPAPFLKGNNKAGSDMFGVALSHTFLYDFNFYYSTIWPFYMFQKFHIKSHRMCV